MATWCTSQKLSSHSNDGWSNYISDQEFDLIKKLRRRWICYPDITPTWFRTKILTSWLVNIKSLYKVEWNMNSLITHLTNDHLRNFIVHLRIVNFFFCLVYYLPDPTLHWAPTAFETNTPFWCTSLFFFPVTSPEWRHDDVTSSKCKSNVIRPASRQNRQRGQVYCYVPIGQNHPSFWLVHNSCTP